MGFKTMDEIYQKYHNELYFYALSLTRDEEYAKDLVSETFYRAMMASNHPSLNDDSFKYWLFRILKNHLIDEERKQRASLTIEKHEPFLMDETFLRPHEQYIQNERNQRLYRYLMSLEPIVYREVIYMYYFAEMSIREIAKSIDKTESNTKTILFRARKKLGRHLKEDSYEF